MVVASVLILVLCIIKVKKLKVDARKSGMPRLLFKKAFNINHLCNFIICYSVMVTQMSRYK